LISAATPFASPRVMDKWFAWPRTLWLLPLPLLTAAALAGIAVATARLRERASRAEWLPFVLAVWVFVFAFAGLAYSLYPYLVIDRLTIWDAAAADKSLRFVLVGTLIVLPFIVAYTVLSYRVFWGKARGLTYGD
ncbi:MAG: cytochrome d ubiquinol oxidase subunit II, partial [Burkholderiales bacterium]|nr:cytochrome d ubiquinol oxidase subunit II [Burkholderiales bacterium]